MATRWYVCPYDFFLVDGTPERRPAIMRYFNGSGNPDGTLCDWAEVLGNHIVVKVIGPDTAHATIQADSDFREIPIDQTIVRPAQRNVIRNKLEAMGYTSQEIDDTGWVVTALLDLLTTAAANWQVNAGRTGIDILPGRRVAPKLVSQIEAALPG